MYIYWKIYYMNVSNKWTVIWNEYAFQDTQDLTLFCLLVLPIDRCQDEFKEEHHLFREIPREAWFESKILYF